MRHWGFHPLASGGIVAGVTHPDDTDRRADVDDTSIVPGLGPGPLDPALDPDRYDPAREAAAGPSGPLEPALDPDRYRPPAPPGQGQTLTDLLGPGAREDERDGYQWAFGLLGVVAFLALVAWLFTSVITP
jgi:hypothetical protein